ncbi:SRPBCC family protein [Longispora urticae]
MSNVSYATSFTVDATPQDAFAAVTNVRGWWAEDIQGDTAAAGDEFVQRYGDMHRCRIRITEAVPGSRVTWLVVENYFSFTEDETEWTGTTMTFDITEKDSGTEVAFTHEGLVPDYECYDVCSNAWAFHVNGSLQKLISTGKGEPTRS